ncbi:MAG TPA: M50 family metallopeptidase [Nevskiaceae bacterium]|nr:M50 family metallopeptidase [Nevskiaceae bacterium]
MSVILLIIGLILFIGLVVVHEFGHFIVARRNGVEVEEFGIGFPPRAWSRKVGKGDKRFDFSLNWLPIGGFVKLKGEHDSDTAPGSFGAASFGAKTKIMLAGVGMNLLAAFVLLTILAWAGMPQLLDKQFTVASDSKVSKSEVLVGYVEKDSPAQQAGLQVRDRLTAIGTPGHLQQINNAKQLPKLTKDYAGQKIALQYARDGRSRTITIQLRSASTVAASQKTSNPKGYLGISPTEYSLTRSTWSAPIVAIGLIKQFTVATFQGLGTAVSALFHGNTAKASEQVSGPVGIFVLLKDGSLLGYQFVLLIIAIISLTLALMNVLPIPALDGGRLFMMVVARALKKPLSEEIEERIVGFSFVLLLLLVGLITVVDVRRFF